MAKINRISILFIIFTFNSFAFDSLELITNRSEGKHLMSIKVAKDKVKVVTNSNIFLKDSKSFGSFNIKNNNSDMLKSLKYYHTQLVNLDNTLKMSGSSLIKMYPKANHDFFYKIDNLVISTKNPYYEKINKLIFDKINSSELIYDKKYTYRGGNLTSVVNKKTKVERMDQKIYCSGAGANGVCTLKKLGFIFL